MNTGVKKKMFRTKAEDRRQPTHVCSPNAFLEVWSVWGLNSRKWMIQNYFTIWELFQTWSEHGRAFHTRMSAAYCILLSSTYVVSAVREPRPLSFACRVHYTTYSPLLPLARTPSLKAPDEQSHLLVEKTHATRNRPWFWQLPNSENYCGLATEWQGSSAFLLLAQVNH